MIIDIQKNGIFYIKNCIKILGARRVHSTCKYRNLEVPGSIAIRLKTRYVHSCFDDSIDDFLTS